MRYTHNEVKYAFKRFLRALQSHNADIDISTYRLDYISHYGGWNIEELIENGGTAHPFGLVRRNTKEMVLSLDLASAALENLHMLKKE